MVAHARRTYPRVLHLWLPVPKLWVSVSMGLHWSPPESAFTRAPPTPSPPGQTAGSTAFMESSPHTATSAPADASDGVWSVCQTNV